jgi:hypothetical protein
MAGPEALARIDTYSHGAGVPTRKQISCVPNTTGKTKVRRQDMGGMEPNADNPEVQVVR